MKAMIKFYIASLNPQFKCENPYFNTLHWKIVWHYFFLLICLQCQRNLIKKKLKMMSLKTRKNKKMKKRDLSSDRNSLKAVNIYFYTGCNTTRTKSRQCVTVTNDADVKSRNNLFFRNTVVVNNPPLHRMLCCNFVPSKKWFDKMIEQGIE